MHDYVRCNKIAGVHWLKKSVDQLIIKVKLKLPDDIISLPKFEDYINETSSLNLEQNTEEFSFRWQEKSFSAYELQHYSDVHNCLTENEFRYHELLKHRNIVPKKVFTYIHEDYYLPLPQEKRKTDATCLTGAAESLGKVIGEKSGSEKHLFKSQEDICGDDEKWTAMHIIFDSSDSNEDLPLRQEAVLVSLYHNIVDNYIIISPDVNNEINLYDVDNCTLGYQYEVQVDFGEEGDEELCTLLSKLYMKWEQKNKNLVNFDTPPVGKRQYFVNLEVISAKEFEMDNLYVEYDIKLPEGVQSKDTLHGRTHVSLSTQIDGVDVWHFGHLIELCLESDSGFDPSPLKIYLEIISIDTWHRHRTEGYCYFSSLLNPGGRTQDLKCVRPVEKGGEERSFYVGGCHLLEDLEVLSNAELQGGEYRLIQSGSLLVSSRSVLSCPGGDPAAGPVPASLAKADAALARYSRARESLHRATDTT